MRIELPKPLHGWRQFTGEVGIIVVGVLLALAAQEGVQVLHWRREVAEARESLNTQLAESMFASMERTKGSDCIARKLDRLDEAIESDRPRIYKIRIGPFRLWSTSAWDAAASSGAIAHMTPEERNQYAALFAFTASMRDMNVREFETENDLRTLIRHRNLNDISRDRLAQDTARLRGLNSMQTIAAQQWVESAKGLDMRLSDEDRKYLARPLACVMPDSPAQG